MISSSLIFVFGVFQTKQGKFAENAAGVEPAAERGRPKSGRVWKNVQMKRYI
jgi:hypothetical protein